MPRKGLPKCHLVRDRSSLEYRIDLFGGPDAFTILHELGPTFGHFCPTPGVRCGSGCLPGSELLDRKECDPANHTRPQFHFAAIKVQHVPATAVQLSPRRAQLVLDRLQRITEPNRSGGKSGYDRNQQRERGGFHRAKTEATRNVGTTMRFATRQMPSRFQELAAAPKKKFAPTTARSYPEIRLR